MVRPIECVSVPSNKWCAGYIPESKVERWRRGVVRALMKEKGLIRTVGCNFTEHGHRIHRFLVNDQAHPESESIYAKLDEVIKKIQKAGYVPNLKFVLHDVKEEVKESLVSKRHKPLIITKNLRIYGDCHNMAKFVSFVGKRKIIIRDTRRFHHFADGLCSCGDYRGPLHNQIEYQRLAGTRLHLPDMPESHIHAPPNQHNHRQD
ncbi:hypothetical protein Ccrd_025981 [Cynara cardunculus var. scolymus]|uniref:DYW domain-containing protein n=1 Tax=Cynara cardunculus var. scolymus TaxID=59895 RepID=A0A103XDL3_CYNCS|nr:hypothetical protein Ccrd_025981 [Cynara cardunculus var. scolymus]